LFGAVYFYFEGIPSVSDFLARQVPTAIETELGKSIRDELLDKYDIDEERTEIINDFFVELNFGGKPKIYVVKSRDFNAVALPGNYIFVFDEVLKEVESYPELAGLLGHEYTHLVSNHGMRMVARNLGYELIRLLIFGDESDAAEFTKMVNLVVLLGYSQEFETEADLNALKLMYASKIEAKGLPDLFKRMEKYEKRSGEDVPSYLRTHPITRDRIEYLQDSIASNPYKPEINLKLDTLFQELTTFRKSKSWWN